MERLRRKASLNRSPDYPAFDLERSIELLMKLYEKEQFSYMAYDAAIEHCGYSAKGSTGQRLVAALLHFGLLEEKGTGVDRRVRLSDLGKRIVLGWGDGSDDYYEALRESAMMPQVYRRLWEQWDGAMPSREELQRHLVLRLYFNPNVVESFMNDFESSLMFAGLMEDPLNSYGTARRNGARHASNGHASYANGRTDEVKPEAPQPFDISIPLTNGNQAKLTIPFPMSETDFDLLQRLIPKNLEILKEALVSSQKYRVARHN
jgi:hypothetical protein